MKKKFFNIANQLGMEFFEVRLVEGSEGEDRE
jgi:hypothetical protein